MNAWTVTAMLANLPEGPYLSLGKILTMIVLLLPWLYVATWVNRDVVQVRAPAMRWRLILAAAGLAGVLLWLLLPWYAAGLVIYLLLVAGAGYGYVYDRNRRVKPRNRVLTAEHLTGLMKKRKEAKVEAVTHVKLYDNFTRPVFAPPAEQQDELQAYNLAQGFLHNVVLSRASQADLTVGGEQASVRYVVDGVVQKMPAIARGDAESIVAYIKTLAGLDVEETRRPQEGKMGVEAGDRPLDVMVQTAGSTQGQRMLLKIVQETARTDLDELGMPEPMRERLIALGARPGLLIVSGPKGSGVTSTVYSLLRTHDAFMKQLATLEARPSVDLENVTQITYADKAALPGQLAKLLRRDPDVAAVDLCPTTQVAKVITDAASEKSILLEMRAESSFKALAQWVKLAGDARQEAVGALHAVLCQVLLRKLCPACREAYQPPKELLARLNIPADKVDRFYRPPTQPLVDEKGNPRICETCRGTGYFGREGAFELLEVTDEIRQLVQDNAPLNQIKSACRKNKMLYLQEQGLRKVIAGQTSIEEVVRVSKQK
jgi:type II secretory ATPase GspE/PulE/Tfp pilus assembly ATPase PilB-like protein